MPGMICWNIIRGRKSIDKVYYDSDIKSDEVKRSLINHDGYPSDIRVRQCSGRRR